MSRLWWRTRLAWLRWQQRAAAADLDRLTADWRSLGPQYRRRLDALTLAAMQAEDALRTARPINPERAVGLAALAAALVVLLVDHATTTGAPQAQAQTASTTARRCM